MSDTDLKSVIAKNITELRKSAGLTQAELAFQLNYTDKAISKWERAESIPDITVLKGMADLFHVPLGYLLDAEHAKPERAIKAASRHRTRNHIVIALLSASFVFFVATVLYVISGLFFLSICTPPLDDLHLRDPYRTYCTARFWRNLGNTPRHPRYHLNDDLGDTAGNLPLFSHS